MRTALGVAAIAAALVASASSAKGADASRRPRAALSASPARIAVAGPAARAVVLRNVGSGTVIVDATRARLGRRSSMAWLALTPRRLALPPGRKALLTIRIAPPRRAEPGRHDALVLLTTRPLRGARVGIRMRLGLVVQVRLPGPAVHGRAPGLRPGAGAYGRISGAAVARARGRARAPRQW